jgi:hypothetical protein
MSITEQFGYIMSYQSTHELVPFLLSLSKKDILLVRTKALEFLTSGIPNARPRQTRGWTIFPPLAASATELGEFIAASNLHALPLAAIQDTTQEESALFFLTGLATYTRKEAFGDGFQWWGSMAHDFFNSRREEVWTVLQHTRPAWLGDWLMGGRGNSLADYWLLRDLEDAGFIEYRPQHFAFRFAWLALNQNPAALAKRLTEDEKALTRDLPLQFEYEVSMARLDGSSAANYQKFTWQCILLDLSKTGHLDRTDLLTRSLLALRRDFRRPILTWFRELFLSLKPTLAERLARQADLLELLTHSQPLVVNFALEQLKNVWAEPGFNLAPLLLCADNLLTRLDLKKGLGTLLVGLGKLAKQQAQAAHVPAVARLLAGAISHPDHSVQERAAKHLAELLQAKKLPLTAAITEVATAIASSAELLSTSARTLLAPWLSAADAQVAPMPRATYLPVSSFVPDILPATAVAAVADWHELLFLTPQVLSQTDPLALERWLDGLLRLRSQLPADYSLQLQPYIKQLVPWLGSKSTLTDVLEHLAEWPPAWSRGLFEALLLSWYEGFASPRVSQVALGRQPIGEVGQAAYSSASDPLCYVNQQRLAFAEVLLANQVQLPLLSTFTHQPYYVSPVVLVEKLLCYQQHGTDPNLADLTIALARTAAHAPIAAAARQLLPGLAHQGLRALLDWYFSPDPAADAPPIALLALPVAWPETLDAALPGLWTVAARTKYPTARLPWLATLEQAAETALDAATPPPIPPAWTSPPESVARLHFMPPRVISGLPMYSAHPVMRPRHGHSAEGWDGYASLRTVYAQLHALVPQHPAPLYSHTLRCATVANNLEAASRELITSALYTLLQPGPVWPLAATQVLASSLIHHHATCRSLGQEVLLRAVANGQLLPSALGQIMGQQLAIGYAPVPRLASSLASLSGIDALTDDALAQTLDALLPALPAAPLRGLRKLAELYADLVARTGRPVPAAVQARLGEWQAAAGLKKAVDNLLAPAFTLAAF